ncbi:MAG: hypothetical protein IMZ64_05165 [Bacteroidetes bacterium]|nr:hypothetical protein [Bacteroidota bacterium]
MGDESAVFGLLGDNNQWDKAVEVSDNGVIDKIAFQSAFNRALNDLKFHTDKEINYLSMQITELKEELELRNKEVKTLTKNIATYKKEINNATKNCETTKGEMLDACSNIREIMESYPTKGLELIKNIVKLIQVYNYDD